MPSKKKKKPFKYASTANGMIITTTTDETLDMDIQKLLPELMEHNRQNGMHRPDIRNMVDRLVETNIILDANTLQIDFMTEYDPARKLQILKNGLLQSGTKIDVLSVDANYSYTHNDVLYGDGDQSKIILDLPRLNNFEWFRNLDATQSAHYEPFSFQTSTRNGNNPNPFLAACLAGKPTEVENLIKKTKFGSKARIHLLDGREAFFRRSALLMVAKSGNIMKDRVGTIRILLKYGARPDARDVCGNNVLHYLANARSQDNCKVNISSSEAIQIADDCINAARCSKYFGKKVIIDNISASAASSTKVRNHSVGILQGYIHDETYTDTGRFTVVLETETLCLRPCNLFQKDHKRGQGQGQYRCIHDASRKLYNEPNRCGAVCLNEYVLAAAKILPQFTSDFALHIMNAHNADVDGRHFTGKTLEELVMGCIDSVRGRDHHHDRIKILQDYFIWKNHERKLFCRQCDKGAEMTCSRCVQACYCSKECQRKHFGVHKKACISPTEQEKIFEGTSVADMTLKGYWAGEIFWLKVTHHNPTLYEPTSTSCSRSRLSFVDRYGGIILNVTNTNYFSKAFLKKVKAKKGTHVKAVIRLYPTRMLVIFPDTANKRSW